ERGGEFLGGRLVGFGHRGFELGLVPTQGRTVLSVAERARRQGGSQVAGIDHDRVAVDALDRTDFATVGTVDFGTDGERDILREDRRRQTCHGKCCCGGQSRKFHHCSPYLQN